MLPVTCHRLPVQDNKNKTDPVGSATRGTGFQADRCSLPGLAGLSRRTLRGTGPSGSAYLCIGCHICHCFYL